MPTVVVVDDDKLVLYTIEEILGDKYFIISYDNPEKAIREIKNGLLYDLLLSDLSSSKGNVTDFINKLKKIRPETPLVCMSGYADPLIDKYLNFNAFLKKPFTSQNLEELISNQLH